MLNDGASLDLINITNIVLLPKVLNPTIIANFRPISLCSVIYKLIVKMVANRFRLVLDKYIDPSQSAFVSSRIILDNILLAYEILHTFSQKSYGKKGCMSLKLDLSKAYD